MCCMACTEYQLGKLTKAEARKNISEMPDNTEHLTKVLYDLVEDDEWPDNAGTDGLD